MGNGKWEMGNGKWEMGNGIEGKEWENWLVPFAVYQTRRFL